MSILLCHCGEAQKQSLGIQHAQDSCGFPGATAPPSSSLCLFHAQQQLCPAAAQSPPPLLESVLVAGAHLSASTIFCHSARNSCSWGQGIPPACSELPKPKAGAHPGFPSCPSYFSHSYLQTPDLHPPRLVCLPSPTPSSQPVTLYPSPTLEHTFCLQVTLFLPPSLSNTQELAPTLPPGGHPMYTHPMYTVHVFPFL